MSGKSSINAAARRRTTNTVLSNKNNNSSFTETNNKQVRIVDILENHELRMRDIEGLINDKIEVNNDEQGEKIKKLELLNKELTVTMSEFEKQISDLKLQLKVDVNNDDDDDDK
jgi:hypothetical protein